MSSFSLTLRQRKILYTLQKHTDYVTGAAIAKEHNVTARTVRTDIRDINSALTPFHAEIRSVNSKGYLLKADDPALINKLNRIENAFLSREDRLFYLTFRLCLSDVPLDLYDLEEDIYVSRSTLLNDLHAIKQMYSVIDPHIVMHITSSDVCFEQDEPKLRYIILRLFHRDWDYNSRGSALYGFHFLDEAFISFLSANVSGIINDHHLVFEDPTLVALILTLAIMQHRVISGHLLPETDPIPHDDAYADDACASIFALIEHEFHLTFPRQEVDAIYLFLVEKSVRHPLSISSVYRSDFLSDVHFTTSRYLQKIKETYQLDFEPDKEFYQVLVLYLIELKNGQSIFTEQQSLNEVKLNLMYECELAYLFQEFAPSFIGHELSEIELVNLAILFEGALYRYLRLHPELKLKALLCCHEKFMTSFTFKRQIESNFSNILDIISEVPIHQRMLVDCSGLDLVFSTVLKTYEAFPRNRVLIYPDTYDHLRSQLLKILLTKLFRVPASCSITDLIRNAFWHEGCSYDNRMDIIETLVSDFIRLGIADETHLISILRHESQFSFAVRPGICFLFTCKPARSTHLSFMTLEHRILWGAYKIRTVVAGVFTQEDVNLLFHLKDLFYKETFDKEYLQELRSKEELTGYFNDGID